MIDDRELLHVYRRSHDERERDALSAAQIDPDSFADVPQPIEEKLTATIRALLRELRGAA